MIKGKKAQREMMWILIAFFLAIALGIIVFIMLSEGTEKGKQGLFGCLGKGGTCLTVDKCIDKDGRIDQTFDCGKDENQKNQVCCFEDE